MTGFDSSAAMLKLARRRLGDNADLLLADLSSPLPFPDGGFDDVIVSLVLHYFQDWTAPLAELRRVLKPGGRLVLSVNHPIQGHPIARPGADCWATYQWSDEYTTFSGPELRTDVLAPAAAHDDRRLHRSGLPDRCDQ